MHALAASSQTGGKPPLEDGRAADVERVAVPSYRPDIDGLRALAVLAVILFHAQVPGFEGGYVGVDVFFVISGFLITQLILADQARALSERLRIFYGRRARRILPALLTMLIVTAAVGVLVLLPSDLVLLGKYVAAAPLLLANLVAWSRSDYFDAAWPMSPLLHVWSVAVEEQFYVAYPLALILCTRYYPRQRLPALVLLAVASVALCVWGSTHRAIANFYLPASRAWELLLGALVALAPLRRPAARWLREVAAGLALLALLAAITFYRGVMDYPGVATIPVCLATAVLLALGPARPTTVHRLLALRPLVFTGLLSYSLYLWHLPVIAFAAYLLIEPLSGWRLALTLAAIVPLAYASFALVERPIRSRVRLPSNRRFIWTAGAASAGIAAVGLGIWVADGLPERMSPEVKAFADGQLSVHPDGTRCLTLSVADLDAGRFCRFGTAADPATTVLVWGDSHAMALLAAYQHLAEARGLRVLFAGHSGCKPLLSANAPRSARPTRRTCDEFNAAMIRAVARLRPDVVIFNSYWSRPNGAVIPRPWRAPVAAEDVAGGLAATLHAIAPYRPALCAVLDPPTLPYVAPYALAVAARRGLDRDFLQVTREAAFAQHAQAEAAIRSIAVPERLTVVDVKDELCRGPLCEVERDGRALYTDRDHLSLEGAGAVEHVLDNCLAPRPRTEQHEPVTSRQNRPAQQRAAARVRANAPLRPLGAASEIPVPGPP